MRSESELLVDVLARLNAAGVEYMLTGSMANIVATSSSGSRVPTTPRPRHCSPRRPRSPNDGVLGLATPMAIADLPEVSRWEDRDDAEGHSKKHESCRG